LTLSYGLCHLPYNWHFLFDIQFVTRRTYNRAFWSNTNVEATKQCVFLHTLLNEGFLFQARFTDIRRSWEADSRSAG